VLYLKKLGAEGLPRATPKRIYVVDDERTIADTLAVILRHAGYEASVFYDAQSALQEADSRTPDLVISDVVMPGMSGVDMAVLIRERHPACKVLLFSGQADTVNVLETARSQGYDFELLAKPVHPTDLLARIATVEPEAKAGRMSVNRPLTPQPGGTA
jgi:DNA-binding response OmpR family regulator